MDKLIKAIMSGVVGITTFLCGLNWTVLIVWFGLLCIDIITGNMKHMKLGTWSSREMKMGLLKKIGECFCLSSLILFQLLISTTNIHVPVTEVFGAAFGFKELGSIIENCAVLGVSLPNSVKKWLKEINVKEEKNNVSDSEKTM